MAPTRVSKLAKSSYLFGAATDLAADLLLDLCGIDALERATSVRHDAIGAELLATARDVDERTQMRELGMSVLTRVVLKRGHGELGIRRRRVGRHAPRCQQRLETLVLAWTEQCVDVRRFGAHNRAIFFGEATGDEQLDVRAAVFDRLERAQAAVDARLGLLANGASVDDDDVRFVRRFSERAPHRPGLMGEPVGVGDVHLTAERLQVD